MIYLEHLFSAPDFRVAVDALANDFRHRYDFPSIYQLGLSVANVEAAAEALEDQGIGPFFIGEGSPAQWRERDESREVRLKIGLAYRSSFELELIQPIHGTDFYSDRLKSVDGLRMSAAR